VNWSAATPTPAAVNTGQAPITDSDGDGIPDTWETTYGLNPHDAGDAAGDADEDGQTNAEEYAAGTDPNDAGSTFTGNVTKIAGGFQVSFAAKAGKAYTVQYRDSLSTGTWLKLTDVAAQGADGVRTVNDLTAVAQRYYRVVTPQVP
jgi:Bacterial TSP3 repeat